MWCVLAVGVLVRRRALPRATRLAARRWPRSVARCCARADHEPDLVAELPERAAVDPVHATGLRASSRSRAALAVAVLVAVPAVRAQPAADRRAAGGAGRGRARLAVYQAVDARGPTRIPDAPAPEHDDITPRIAPPSFVGDGLRPADAVPARRGATRAVAAATTSAQARAVGEATPGDGRAHRHAAARHAVVTRIVDSPLIRIDGEATPRRRATRTRTSILQVWGEQGRPWRATAVPACTTCLRALQGDAPFALLAGRALTLLAFVALLAPRRVAARPPPLTRRRYRPWPCPTSPTPTSRPPRRSRSPCPATASTRWPTRLAAVRAGRWAPVHPRRRRRRRARLARGQRLPQAVRARELRAVGQRGRADRAHERRGLGDQLRRVAEDVAAVRPRRDPRVLRRRRLARAQRVDEPRARDRARARRSARRSSAWSAAPPARPRSSATSSSSSTRRPRSRRRSSSRCRPSSGTRVITHPDLAASAGKWESVEAARSPDRRLRCLPCKPEPPAWRATSIRAPPPIRRPARTTTRWTRRAMPRRTTCAGSRSCAARTSGSPCWRSARATARSRSTSPKAGASSPRTSPTTA